MKIDALLTTAVRTCRTTDPLSSVAQAMWEGDLGCLPVLDAEERVVGMLTDRDMLMATHLRGTPLWSIQAGDVMSHVVHALAAEATAQDAAELMARLQLRRVPVLDTNGRLLGILSLSSLARGVTARTCDLSPTDIATTLACICGPRFPAPESSSTTGSSAADTLQPAPRKGEPTKAGTTKAGTTKSNFTGASSIKATPTQGTPVNASVAKPAPAKTAKAKPTKGAKAKARSGK